MYNGKVNSEVLKCKELFTRRTTDESSGILERAHLPPRNPCMNVIEIANEGVVMGGYSSSLSGTASAR
jgi:hypothetical protein